MKPEGKLSSLDVVRTFIDGLAAGEPDVQLLDEQVEVEDHDLPDMAGKVWRGRDEYLAWITAWDSAWEEWVFEAEELIGEGDTVVQVLRMHVRSPAGVTLDRQDAVVSRVRHGKITRTDYFNNRPEAMRFAGLT